MSHSLNTREMFNAHMQAHERFMPVKSNIETYKTLVFEKSIRGTRDA